MQQRLPYIPPRGGLFTPFNNKYPYLGSLTKNPILDNILPYLQIMHIQNQPL